MSVIDSLLPLGTEPIPGDSPSGVSVRYEEVFGRFEGEINKLDNPSGPTIDWKQADADGRTILAERSKDILVAAYLCRALYELHGVEGASAGLTVCRSMLDTFWEGLHPQRVRPRRAALEWISERLTNLLDPLTVRATDQPHILIAQGVVEDIWNRYNDKFEGEDCGLASIRRRLGDIVNSNAPAATEATSGGESSATPGATASHGGGGGGASGPVGNRTVAIQRLNEVALYFSTYEPHSPVGMLVNRAIHWSQIGFEELFKELLKDRQDAQDHLWNMLGIKKPDA
jgi:type VI secretion system ImpA/VasJ family protein